MNHRECDCQQLLLDSLARDSSSPAAATLDSFLWNSFRPMYPRCSAFFPEGALNVTLSADPVLFTSGIITSNPHKVSKQAVPKSGELAQPQK